MRNCPSCGTKEKDLVISGYNGVSVINAGYAPELDLYKCNECGMHYVDGAICSQEFFDNYYMTKYRTDDAPYSDARLFSLAECVKKYRGDNRSFRVLDIGGMDGELAQRINSIGLLCLITGVGLDHLDVKDNDGVILSHTLEHIYDIPAMFARIKRALKPGGLLFIEVPIWFDYSDLTYDNHWQHINKFRSKDLDSIFGEFDFEILESLRLPSYREYDVWRIVGRML